MFDISGPLKSLPYGYSAQSMDSVQCGNEKSRAIQALRFSFIGGMGWK